MNFKFFKGFRQPLRCQNEVSLLQRWGNAQQGLLLRTLLIPGWIIWMKRSWVMLLFAKFVKMEWKPLSFFSTRDHYIRVLKYFIFALPQFQIWK